MTPLIVIAAATGLVLLGCAARRAPRKPDVGWDVKDPKFQRMVRNIERRDSGGHGRID